jgi:hypothetical protein
MKSHAQIAYEAFAKAMGLESNWDQLTDREREAWWEVAHAIDVIWYGD